MDFSYSPEEMAFQEGARAWLEARVVRRGNPQDGAEQHGYFENVDRGPELLAEARDWQRQKAAGGWAALTWPIEHGGQGASVTKQVLWESEEDDFLTPPNVFTIGLGYVGPTIMAYGTTEQKAEFLRRIIDGTDLWCQLFSEPEAGSDLANVRTRVTRSGSEWEIEGEKIWTSRAHYADMGFLLARSEAGSTRHQGLTCFLLPMHTLGVVARPLRQSSGLSNFNSVRFDGVRIDDSFRIGPVGEGWRVCRTSLANERVSIGMKSVRLTRNVFEQLFAKACRPSSTGHIPIDDPVVRLRLAEFYRQVVILRLSGYRMLTAISDGHEPGPEGSLLKLMQGRLIQDMCTEALSFTSLAADSANEIGAADWNYAFMNSSAGRIGGGTDEIQRNIIAERVLRLPKEPSVSRDISRP